MPPIANGHVATVPFTDTVYMNGLYNGVRGESHRARIPSLHNVRVDTTAGNKPLLSESFALDTYQSEYKRVLARSAYPSHD